MGDRRISLRWASVACLGLAACAAVLLLWPSPRTRIELHLAGDPSLSEGILPSPTATSDSPPTPSLDVRIDLPESLLLGREEECALAIGLPAGLPTSAVYSVSLAIRSPQAEVLPAGEMGQALRSGMRLEWQMRARDGSEVSATLLLRLRWHSGEGAADGERLLLAWDLTLPVRKLAGLSAPIARLVAASLGLAGALLSIAATPLPRR